MVNLLIKLINLIVQLISLLVIIKVVLSYFMTPYHPSRLILDRIVEPMLILIRKFIPNVGIFDLSPFILIIMIQFFGRIVISLFYSIS